MSKFIRVDKQRDLIDKVLNREDLTEREERIAMSPEFLSVVMHIESRARLIEALEGA